MKNPLITLLLSAMLPICLHAEEITKYRAVVRISGPGAKGNHWESKELYATAGEAQKAAAAHMIARYNAGVPYTNSAFFTYTAGSSPVKVGK